MAGTRVEKLADVLTEYSLPVQPGARVLLRSSTAAEPLVMALYERLLDRGAHVFMRLSLPHAEELFYAHARQAQLDYLWQPDLWLYENCEAMFAIFSDVNPRHLANVDPGLTAAVVKARGPLLETQMRRTAAGDHRWVLSLFPTEGYAQEAGMSLREYEDFYFSACLLDDPDPIAAWRRTRDELEGLKQRLDGSREVRIEAPGTDLRIGVSGRTWIPCSGSSNFPDGEIFTGPEEEVTSGHVTFTFPATYMGKQIEGIRLEFDEGRVVGASARTNEEFLHRMLRSDDGSSVLGELGIGTNFGITRFTGNVLLDEKIGGTVHLALGAAYPETGGRNQSAVHWDMVCDLRQGGRVTVDGQVLLDNGKFSA